MIDSHENNYAAGNSPCQPNVVRVGQTGDSEFADSPADPIKEWERYCFEQGFRTLDEVCGPYEPPSLPQTWVQRLCGYGRLPDWQMGFWRWLRGESEGSRERPAFRGFRRLSGLKLAQPQKRVAQSLSWHRNYPLIFSMVGLAVIMVKLAASRCKCAGRPLQGSVPPKQGGAA